MILTKTIGDLKPGEDGWVHFDEIHILKGGSLDVEEGGFVYPTCMGPEFLQIIRGTNRWFLIDSFPTRRRN